MSKFFDSFENKRFVNKYSKREITSSVDEGKFLKDVIKTKATALLRVQAEEAKQNFEVHSWELYKAAQAVSKSKPFDKGMKFAVNETKRIWEESNGGYIETSELEPVQERISKMFPSSYSNKFFTNDIARLSPQTRLDTRFLAKVADLISDQEDYNDKMQELGFGINRDDCKEARSYVANRVNERLGADQVNDEFFDYSNKKVQYESLMSKEINAVDQLENILSQEWSTVKASEKVYDIISDRLVAKKDVKIKAFDTNDIDTQVDWANSQLDNGFDPYVVETGDIEETILVSTNMSQQEAEDTLYERLGTSIKLNAFMLEAREWRYKLPLDISEPADNPNLSDNEAEGIASQVIETLEEHKEAMVEKLGISEGEIDSLIESFRSVSDLDDFDYALSELYDFADNVGIWVGPDESGESANGSETEDTGEGINDLSGTPTASKKKQQNQ